MTLAQLIPLALKLSMAGLLLSIAFKTDFRDLGYLLRHPRLLLRSVLAMNVIMPAYALAMALVLALDHAIEVALIAMALAPVPPILPGKELKAGGYRSYTMGLLTVSAVLSIVFVPAAAAWLGSVFGQPIDLPFDAIAGIVATWMLAPLLIGATVRLLAPRFAAAAARPLSLVATGLLLLAFIPVLIQVWPKMLELVGNFTIVAIVVFVLVGLLVGHVLGGPDPRDRTVLALSCATRHPAVALAILHADPDRTSTSAAVLLVLLVGAIASMPYVKWRRRAVAEVPITS